MIARLLVFLVVYAGGGYTLFWGGMKIFKRTARGRLWLEKRERRRQGLINARKVDFNSEDLCTVCVGKVDPKIDLFDGRTWIHKSCHGRIEGEVEAATTRSLPATRKERT